MAETLNTVNGAMKTLMGYEIYDEAARTSIAELEESKADTSHTHSADDIVDGTVSIEHGGTGAETAAAALNNLGITWGTEEAPATGTPNTIYIQIN